MPLLRQLRSKLPSGLTALPRLPGIGPKRVGTLYQKLSIQTVADLHHALLDGRVSALPGFGEKLAAHLLEAINAGQAEPARIKKAIAGQFAEPLKVWLHMLSGVFAVEIAGSYRRARDTVGDINIVIAAVSPARAVGQFIAYP